MRPERFDRLIDAQVPMSAIQRNSCGYGSWAAGEVSPGFGLTSRRTYLLSGGLLVCPTCGGHFEERIAPWKRSLAAV
jgi:hypothetical protein